MDVPIFSYLCELVQRIFDTKRILKEEGQYYDKVTVDGSGQEHTERKEHPAANRLEKLEKERRIVEKSFVARVNAHPIKKEDPMEEFNL